MTTVASGNVSDTWTWLQVEWGSWDTILQLVSAFLGALGNLMVIIVLFPRRSSSRSTDTLIGCLAVADFLTSLFLLPFPRAAIVPSNWIGMFYCWTAYTNAFLWICITASIYTLLFICVDRYVAVVFPLKHNRYLTRICVQRVVGAIWLCSLANFITSIGTKIDPTTNECVVLFPSEFIKTFFGSLNFLFLYFIPVMIMLFTQILIARFLLRQSILFSANKTMHSPSFHLAARRKVLKTMALIVIVFIISLGPNQISYFLYNLGILPHDQFYLNTFHRFTVVLASFNSCANPFIYAWQNKRFREGIRNMWTRSTSSNTPIFDHM